MGFFLLLLENSPCETDKPEDEFDAGISTDSVFDASNSILVGSLCVDKKTRLHRLEFRVDWPLLLHNLKKEDYD